MKPQPHSSSPQAPALRLGRLLIVDDEVELMTALREALTAQGYDVAGFASGQEALAALKETDFDLLLTDLMMPGMDGIALLREGLKIDPHLIGIIMTGHGTVQTAVNAMKVGAFDYVLKPFKLNAVLPILARAMNVRRLRKENVQLCETVAIYELCQTIEFTLDLNTVLNKTIDAVLQLCGADEGSIMLPAGAGDELYIAVVRGEQREHLLGERLSMERGIAGWVVRHREPLTLYGEVSDPRFAPVRPRLDIRSAILMPMMVGNKLVGVLNVNATRKTRPFTLGQVKALTILTSTASAVLEAAWLYDQARQNEDRHRLVLENVDEIIYRVGIFPDRPFEGKVEFVSRRVENIIGYKPQEFLDDPGLWLRLVHPDDVPAMQAQTKAIFDSRRGGAREYRVRHKTTGEYRWVEDRVVPRYDAMGNISTVFGVAHDITPRKLMEEETRRTRNFLDSIVENLPAVLFVKDTKDLRYVRLNKAGEEILGSTRDHVIGKTDYDLFPKEMADSFTARDREALTGGGLCDIPEESIHTRNKGTRIVRTKKIPILDESGRPLYLLGISEDITDRRMAEDVASRLGRILDDSSNEIYAFDAATLRFVQVNHGAQRNLGYSMEELRDMTPLDIKPEYSQEQFESLLAPLRRGEQELVSFETVHKRRDGSLYPVEVRLQLSRRETPPVFVAIILDITERKHAHERLSYLAYYDTLTGLPNRVLLNDRLQQAMIEADQHGRLVAVMFLDLDRFKTINDTLGHDIGDALLREVAHRLMECVRPGDSISRHGGDEFTVVLANVARVDDVGPVAQKILDCFVRPLHIGGHELFVSTSVGITLYPLDDKNIDNLLKNADAAMYHAKESGRNTFRFFTAELNTRAARRLSLETSLRHALQREELLLHYQPQLDLETQRLLGVEALLRWRHPEHGLVSPADFIPLAEETGLIVSIGEWVLRTACAQSKKWQAAGLPPLRLSVNLSARQLQQGNLVETIARILKETGLEPGWLGLELTESALMYNLEAASTALRELGDMGIELSIDDFGIGYSSLSYLKRFPIDILKIDQSFVRNITTDPDDAAIATAIIAMAHSLDMKVIAEGVETAAQLTFLRMHRCDAMQGYYFSKPMPADKLDQFIRAQK